MGLMISYAKIAARKLILSIQKRQASVARRITRVQKEIENVSNMLTKSKQRELNSLTAWSNSSINALQSDLSSSILGAFQNTGKLTEEQQAEYNRAYANFQQTLATQRSQIEQNVAWQKQEIENKYEQMEENMKEPLSQEDEALGIENESLTSRLQFAQANYEALQKAEQADAKNLVPSYTGNA